MKEEKDIQRGFNQGYLLKKHKPELALKMEKGLAKDQSPFSIGFKAGAKEASLETLKNKKRTYSVKKSTYKAKLKGKSKDLDKGL